METQSEWLWVEPVVGSRRLSNYSWALFLLLGSLGFLAAGLSSYLGKDIVPLVQSQSIRFAPQGLIMCFYALGGLSLSLSLWSAIVWNVGSGHNEFDRQAGVVSMFRWGFPGEDRRIRVRCAIEDIQAVRLQAKERINLRRTLSLRMKDQQEVPVLQIGESIPWSEAEAKAAQLARFLRVPMVA